MTELLFRDDGYLRSSDARVIEADERGIRLDRTVFYPMGGGQPGDTGVLRLASGQSIAVVDAVKGEAPDEVIHIPAPGSARIDPAAGTWTISSGRWPFSVSTIAIDWPEARRRTPVSPGWPPPIG